MLSELLDGPMVHILSQQVHDGVEEPGTDTVEVEMGVKGDS